MPTTEPLATALLLATFGLLLLVSVVFSRASERVAVPLTLVFLGVGMLAGSEGIGGIPFSDYAFAFRLGSIALVLILFDAGVHTPTTTFRRYLAPALALATAGVFLTAIFVAVVLQSSRSERVFGTALLAIPLTLVAIHLAAIPTSGASVNPARSFAPALVGNEWEDLWIYLLAPLAGAAIGAFVHLFLYGRYVVADVETVELRPQEDASR
jgi:hypothetical protein